MLTSRTRVRSSTFSPWWAVHARMFRSTKSRVPFRLERTIGPFSFGGIHDETLHLLHANVSRERICAFKLPRTWWCHLQRFLLWKANGWCCSGAPWSRGKAAQERVVARHVGTSRRYCTTNPLDSSKLPRCVGGLYRPDQASSGCPVFKMDAGMGDY